MTTPEPPYRPQPSVDRVLRLHTELLDASSGAVGWGDDHEASAEGIAYQTVLLARMRAAVDAKGASEGWTVDWQRHLAEAEVDIRGSESRLTMTQAERDAYWDEAERQQRAAEAARVQAALDVPKLP